MDGPMDSGLSLVSQISSERRRSSSHKLSHISLIPFLDGYRFLLVREVCPVRKAGAPSTPFNVVELFSGRRPTTTPRQNRGVIVAKDPSARPLPLFSLK
ncbi:hypothetical protein CEXT_46071 [Caerostris extrusa]|uniref:Uncharacterized protein n=1 Tax=Caerostris extrusa TaxID=172846 RepID=A0AAV4XE51_CAEEX|nr:hypothetical protein CEXT_46071 [Caerostris extrusa]